MENQKSALDLENIEIAFSSKSNEELKQALYIFKLIQIPFLVNIGSTIGLWLIKLNFPLVKTIIKKTIFKQFCGGESLAKCQPAISELSEFQVQTILDYGAEAKSSPEDFKHTLNEFIKAIQYAAKNESVPTISMKITGLIEFDILTKRQSKERLSAKEEQAYKVLEEQLDQLATLAEQNKVRIFVDAEESWIQDVIDDLVRVIQEKYNKREAIIFNTFQMYRHDRLDYLRQSYRHAKDKKYIIGVKLVRGAYMEKERARAKELGYLSPIQIDKLSTDADYNEAIKFCMDHIEMISMYNASHNVESNLLMTQLIDKQQLDRNHPHLNFCQLFGMSDFITFNLASAGFSVTKYMPYGEIKEVIPYLIRRAEENSSVQGEMGREFQMIYKEVQRRRDN